MYINIIFCSILLCTIYPILGQCYVKLSAPAKKEHNSGSKGATQLIVIKPELTTFHFTTKL